MARGEGYELTGADVGAARDHAAAAAGTLGPGTHVNERIAGSVADDGPAARRVRQCLGDSTRTHELAPGAPDGGCLSPVPVGARIGDEQRVAAQRP